MKKKQKVNKKTIFKVIIILLVMIASLNFVYLKYEEGILNNEVKILSQKDFSKDEFNTSIKTFANYRKVEMQIKCYLIDYSKKSKEVYGYINDDKLKNVLSAANYESDGKEFNDSFAYLDKFSIDFNKSIDELISFSSKDVIMSYIKKENTSPYFEKVYYDYMFNASLGNKIKDNRKEMKNKKKTINKLVSKQRKVITFLKGSNTWTVKDNKIIFSNNDDLNKYNDLIKDIS